MTDMPLQLAGDFATVEQTQDGAFPDPEFGHQIANGEEPG